MAKPQTEPRSTRTRRPRLRPSVVALAMTSALTAESAQAVQVISITSLATTQYSWNSGYWYEADGVTLRSSDFYVDFASTCPNVGGAQCGVNTGGVQPAPDSNDAVALNPQVLFSWGEANDNSRNSRVRVVNNTSSAFQLNALSIASSGAVLTGLDGVSKGSGAAPPWEWADASPDTLQN